MSQSGTRPASPEWVVTPGSDARQDPVRLVVLQADQRPAVEVEDEPVVMTFPHLMLRELIALLSISIVLVVISLLFDAPLEELANPEKTPNPAKAPWYFLGLQELLHYYPPIVAGVILPGIVVLSLAIIPYFDINLRREPLWASGPLGEGAARARRTLLGIVAGIGLASAVFIWTAAHPVWPILVPLWLVGVLMAVPAVSRGPGVGLRGWLGRCSLAFWIFVWFLLVAVTLTVIGVFFRGPGWALVLPWRDGLFY